MVWGVKIREGAAVHAWCSANCRGFVLQASAFTELGVVLSAYRCCRTHASCTTERRLAQPDNDHAFVLTVPDEKLCKQAFLIAAHALAVARLLRISCVCVPFTGPRLSALRGCRGLETVVIGSRMCLFLSPCTAERRLLASDMLCLV